MSDFRPRSVNQLEGVVIDEVSVVDRGANQHAALLISKSLDDGTVDAYFADADTGDRLADYADVFYDGVTDEGTTIYKMDPSASDLHVNGSDESDDDEDDKPRAAKHGTKGHKCDEACTEEYGGDDPSELTAHENKGDVGPAKGKVKKNEGFWANVVKNFFGTQDSAEVSKSVGNFARPQALMQSPFPGAAGPGQPPAMQTPAAQAPVMGQPTAPAPAMSAPQLGLPQAGAMPQQPGLPQQAPAVPGMPQMQMQPQLAQLPPEVVQYIQSLEQKIAELQGQNQQDSGDSSNQSQNQNPFSADSAGDDEKNNPFGKSGDFAMDNLEFLQELSKSLDNEDQREAISKALEEVSKANDRAAQAEEIAKAERDLRVEREFVEAVRKNFSSLPVSPEELGPVVKRLYEQMDEADVLIIEKCLGAADAVQSGYFAEFGKSGYGSNGVVFDEVEMAAAELSKSSGTTREQAISKLYDEDPSAYEQWLAENSRR